jgi:hypothetical protein
MNVRAFTKPSILVALLLCGGGGLHGQNNPAEPGPENGGGKTWPRKPRYVVVDLGAGLTPKRITSSGKILLANLGSTNGGGCRWIAGTRSLLQGGTPVDMSDSGEVVGHKAESGPFGRPAPHHLSWKPGRNFLGGGFPATEACASTWPSATRETNTTASWMTSRYPLAG